MAEETSLVSVSWASVQEDATFWHAAVTDVAKDDDLVCRLRVLCHILVDEMPRDGLAELAESLKSMHDFYVARLEAPVQLSLPVHVYEGALTGTHERPEFFVTDE